MTISDVLQLLQLKDSIGQIRPDLARLMSEPDGRLMTIDLPDGPVDARPKVVVAKARAKGTLVWAIGGHAGKAGFVTTAWPTSSDTEALRNATLAVYDGCVASRLPDSPWCWNQPVVTPVVRVADALTDAGVQVDRVVSTNRLIDDAAVGQDEAYKWIPSSIGDALRIPTDTGSVTLAYRIGLGWILDTSDEDNAWRMDLGELATGRPSDAPGLITEDPARLVGAVERFLASGATPPNPLKVPTEILAATYSDTRVTAGRWLHAMGFSTVTAPEHDSDGWGGPLHVVTEVKSWSLSALKVAYADANVAGKHLVIFSEAGFSAPAEKWASSASVPLFLWPPSHERISPRSAAAEVLMPSVL